MIQEINHFDLDSNNKNLLYILEKEDVVIVKNVPIDDNSALLKLATTIGIPSLIGITDENQLIENDFIHRVQSKKKPTLNSMNFPVLSTTNKMFPLHTDEYFIDNPCDFAMFLCIIPDSKLKGKSKIARLNKILDKLDPKSLKLLKEDNFPHPSKLVSIIDSDCKQIRFNFYEIENYYLATETKLPLSLSNPLTSLLSVAEEVKETFHLNAGDCLIVNNKTVLHGRESFSKDSNRLIKRVRLNRFNQKPHKF